MQQKQKRKNIDIGGFGFQQAKMSFLVEQNLTKNKSILFSRGKKTNVFFTEDSKLYITPREQQMIGKGIELGRKTKKWDSLSSRTVKNFVRYQPSATSLLCRKLEERYEKMNETALDARETLLGQFSMIRLWNASIVGSILFGMVMMTFVYRYLGQGAAANQIVETASSEQQVVEKKSLDESENFVADKEKDAKDFAAQVAEIQKIESEQSLETEIRKMVKGYPIEEMVPEIAKQDRTIAAFIVAIAKKESAWGVRVPVLKGQDCHNYWGYRGQRVLMGTGGHTCFNSPKDAVETVAKRITTLVEKQGKDTPAEMVKTWKCGGNCAATGGQAAADKWVSDVKGIFDKFETQRDDEIS